MHCFRQVYAKKHIFYKNTLKCNGELYACLKKSFDIQQSIAQTSKNQTSLDFPIHKEYENPLFGICRVNETKVTCTYLRCSKNKAFYCDFFIEKDFVSGYTDGY